MTLDERGGVTPLAVSGIVLCAVVAVLLSILGGALVTVRQTQSAADLAALAGASALQHGRDGCAAAEHIAATNDTTLMDCTVDGQVVTVRVSRLAPRMFGRDLVVRALARSGPR
jgi:secretion/DNA translocation related TadE-like protein